MSGLTFEQLLHEHRQEMNERKKQYKGATTSLFGTKTVNVDNCLAKEGLLDSERVSIRAEEDAIRAEQLKMLQEAQKELREAAAAEASERKLEADHGLKAYPFADASDYGSSVSAGSGERLTPTGEAGHTTYSLSGK